MQNGPKFLVAATFEKANTYILPNDAIHNAQAGEETVRRTFFAFGQLV